MGLFLTTTHHLNQDVAFIDTDAAGNKNFGGVQEGDVVILPAFGASVHEMKLLHDKQVQIVDTTCPWVAKVWNAVDNQTRKGHTSVIHGKWQHEETVATASFAGTYVIVKDMKEAEYVCDYILNGGDREEFLSKFENAMSEGFDPDRDLDRVGLANQTTMLKVLRGGGGCWVGGGCLFLGVVGCVAGLLMVCVST